MHSREIFGIIIENENEWDPKYFYICRIWIDENLPTTSKIAYKQNSLRLLREYLLVPTLVWSFCGISISINSCLHGYPFIGSVLFIVIIFFILLCS